MSERRNVEWKPDTDEPMSRERKSKMKEMMRMTGFAILAAFGTSLSNVDSAEAPHRLFASGMNNVLVFQKREALDQVRDIIATAPIFPVGTEADVLVSDLGRGWVKAKVTSGPHTGEIIWISAFSVTGCGRLIDKAAKIDPKTGKLQKVCLFRDEAAFEECRSCDLIEAILSGRARFLPQNTKIEIINASARAPKHTMVRILDEGKDKGTTLLATTAEIVLEGKVKLSAPNLREVKVFRNENDLDRLRRITEEMIGGGGLFQVPNGTRVRILSGDATGVNVEMVEGDNTGKTGWVYPAWVTQSSGSAPDS